jgi:AraC-like DNA-binding protein
MQFHVPSSREASTKASGAVPGFLAHVSLPGAVPQSLAGPWGAVVSQSLQRGAYTLSQHLFFLQSASAFRVSAAVDTAALVFVLEGAAELVLQGAQPGPFLLQAPEGCLLNVPAGAGHRAVLPGGRSVWVEIDAGPAFLPVFRQMPEGQPLAPPAWVLDTLRGPTLLSSPVGPGMQLDGRVAAVVEAFSAALASLADAPLPVSHGPLADKRLLSLARRAAALLDALPGKKMTIPALASRCGTNTATLKKIFKQAYGQTVHQRWLDNSLGRAMELVSAGEMGVRAIALDCGFRNASHFVRQFKRRFGATPGSLRKKA